MKLATIVSHLRRYIDFFDQYNLLSPRDVRRISGRRFLRAFAQTIVEAKKARIAGHEFSTTKLRTLTGKHADALLTIDRKLQFKRDLNVFLGHRFVDHVTKNLRHNLQTILRPYRIRLMYSDSDMRNAQIFDTILRHIKHADFCIFDDRETEVQPNVFIEMGAAISRRRHYFYFNFLRKRVVVIAGTKQKIETPSDLGGMLRLPYSTYEGLFFEFATRLPGFLTARKLATR